MKRNFYIEDIKDPNDLNKLSILLNEQDSVTQIKIGKKDITFTCLEIETIEPLIKQIDDSFVLKEIINQRKRQYKVQDEKTKKYFLFSNLDNIEDAKKIEEVLSKYGAYEDVSLDFSNKMLTLSTKERTVLKRLNRIIEHINPDIRVEQWKKPFKSSDIYQEKYVGHFIRIAIFLIAIALALVTKDDPNYFTTIGWALALICVSENTIRQAYKNLISKQFSSENILILFSCVFGFVFQAYLESIIVMLLYRLSQYLLERLSVYTIDKIDDKINVPQLGRKEEKGEISMISLEEFDIGDTIVVLPGEVIPLGGKIIEGKSQVNTYAINGSDVLVDVKAGDELNSGYVNVGSVIKMEVLYTFERSAISKIMEIASMAPIYESKLTKVIDLVANYFTLALVLLALYMGVFLPFYDQQLYFKYVYTAAILLAITGAFAYRQATSFGVLAGVSKAFSKGILITENRGLDSLNLCETIIYDRFDGAEVSQEELDFFEKLSKLYKKIIIFNDGPTTMENDQYEIYNDLTVEEKIDIMDKAEILGPVVYIGDSYKDIDLLEKSFVGISRGGVHNKRVVDNSDIVITSSNYDSLIEVFKIAKKQKYIRVENIYLSITVKIILLLAALMSAISWPLALFLDILAVVFVILNTQRIVS